VPPPAPAQPATATDWTQYLITKTTKDGIVQPVKHHENAVIVLRYHPAWVGKLRYNEHSRRAIVADPPWHEPDSDGVAGTREWSDTDSARLSGWIRREIGGLDLTVADCERAVAIVSESAPCHPLREWLGSLQWDGQPRLDSWLAAYLGAELSRYTSLAGRWWMISAVARTFQPGCKADLVLILEGPQGLRKSSALRTLASPEYFSDTPIDIGSKDAYLAIQGRVIVELAELDTLKRADADRAKAFFSSPSDSYRPPYGRRTITVQRSCVFAGTVNRGQYLVDDTGNRRYLPVACTAIDLGQLARDRDQLWAEAVAMYRSGVPWWPSLEEAVAAAAEQEKRAEGDAWVDILRAYLETGRDRTTLEEVLTQALGVEKSRMDRSAQMRASKALTRLGWVRRRGSDGRWYYVFSQPRQ
jgi:predicted P-loop ATPase